jgi:hypothetical protein
MVDKNAGVCMCRFYSHVQQIIVRPATNATHSSKVPPYLSGEGGDGGVVNVLRVGQLPMVQAPL